MPKKTRRRFSRTFKAKVALEALSERSTLSELAAKYNLHPNQVSTWKKQAKDGLPEVFGSSAADDQHAQQQLNAKLYAEIGRLKMELDWLKKKSEQLN
jgi:transposase